MSLVDESYIVLEDMAIIKEWANTKNTTISFREAGTATLDCLRRGAGAKPHTILDKTIKDRGTIDGYNPVENFYQEFADRIRARTLCQGLVGHWSVSVDGLSVIDGIYLTAIGKKTLQEDTVHRWEFRENQNNMPYLVLNQESKNWLTDYYKKLCEKNNKKEDYYFFRMFFSGDYDVHDLMQVGQIICSKLDMELLKPLQTALIHGRKEQLKAKYRLSGAEFSGENEKDYQRVQHGPQYNYTVQMILDMINGKDENKLSVISKAVCIISAPLALYPKINGTTQKKEWLILNTQQDILNFYESKAKKIKDTLKNSTKRDEYIVFSIEIAIAVIFSNTTGALSRRNLIQKLKDFSNEYKQDFEKYFNKAIGGLTEKHVIAMDDFGNYVLRHDIITLGE